MGEKRIQKTNERLRPVCLRGHLRACTRRVAQFVASTPNNRTGSSVPLILAGTIMWLKIDRIALLWQVNADGALEQRKTMEAKDGRPV